MKTFEQLPAKTKELELLKDQAEKSTGQESAALNKKIRDKSKHPHKYEPSHPFQPRIDPDPGHLVASPSASRRACGEKDDDERGPNGQHEERRGSFAGREHD